MEITFITMLIIVTTAAVSANVAIPKYLPPFLSDERRLYHKLIDPLDKSLRPVKNHDDTIQVSFGVLLTHMDDLDERIQVLRNKIWVTMSWIDPQLTWDPNNYGGIQSIRIPSTKVWIPDVVPYNAARTSDSLLPRFEWLQVVVYSTGTVAYIPHFTLETTCAVDFRKFPYDTQTCEMKFGSWTYDIDLVNVTLSETDFIDKDYYMEHQAWDLTDHTVKLNHKKFDCCPETYADVTYTLTLKRHANYYTHLFIIPSIIICFITPTLFWLPPDGSETMVLGSGAMIGQILLLTLLETTIPTSHPVVPQIGVYQMFGIVMLAVALILSVLVRNIWNQGNGRKYQPWLIQKIVFVLEKALCAHCIEDPEEVEGDVRKKWHQLGAILDRLFFWLFLIITIIVTIAVLAV